MLDDNLMPLLPKLENNPIFTDDVTSYLTDEKYQVCCCCCCCCLRLFIDVPAR